MFDFLKNIFTNEQSILPQRNSKNLESDVSDENITEINNLELSETSVSDDEEPENNTSELELSEKYELDNLSETSANEQEPELDLYSNEEELLDSDEISQTSFDTVTELDGGFTEELKNKDYNKILYKLSADLKKMLNE